MKQEELKKILPHRDNMLLIDEQNCGTALHMAKKPLMVQNGF